MLAIVLTLLACTPIASLQSPISNLQPPISNLQSPISNLPLRYATTKEVRFDHLSLEQGLSQSVVLDILQDSQGFMWFATQDGLNRYDGYEFRIFKHDSENSNSLSADFISAIAQNQDEMIWIGTNGGGLNHYDPATGQFARYQHNADDPATLSDDIVNDVFIDRDNTLWVGTTNGGLCQFESEPGRFVCYLNDPEDPLSLSNNNVQAIAQDQEGALWIGTLGGGVNKFDRGSEHFIRYQNDPADPLTLSSDEVQELYVDSAGVVWIGTAAAGLNRFEPETERFTRFQHDPHDRHSLANDAITALLQDRAGVLWVGTDGGGLNALDPQSGQFTRYLANADDPAAISSNQIWSAFEDAAGILWFGTFGSGLNKFDPARQKFALFRQDPGNPNGLNNNLVWAFHEDRDGILWIGTNGGGLNCFDPDSGQWLHYRFDPDDPYSLPGDYVVAIHEDRQGRLWLGTDGGGLSRLNRAAGQFIRYDTFPSIADIHEDRAGQLWLGAFGGLGKYDGQTDQFNFYQNDPDDPHSLSDNGVVAIVDDPDGILWVGTFNGGLNRFDPQTEEFVHYRHDSDNDNSLVNDMILSLHLASNGILWLGTIGGLDRFDPLAGTFTHYGEHNGLLNDTIYAILEDGHGNLWFSSNMGLTRFNPQTETFEHFAKRDGLQSNEFNQWAAYKTSSGEMLFGGINGFNAFHPDLVHRISYIPPVVITGFQLFNEPVFPGPGSPLTQLIESTAEVELSYQDDFFTFEFAALHYSSPEDNQYAYMLEGFDKDWNNVGTRRFAGYTNVPPGNYTFRVKATNSDGIWNEAGPALRIVIPLPFWQTWWFRATVALGLVVVVASAVAWRVRTIDLQRQQLALQVNERTKELQETLVQLEHSKEAAEAANRAKSIFLANMSHEFRTPLNAILGFTRLMLHDTSFAKEQIENLGIIYRSSEHLLGLINDVLELSKIEAGRTLLNLQSFDLHRMLIGLEEMFRLRAESKGLALHLDLARDVPRFVVADAGRLRQVLMNLLGNAVKFTEQGHVWLRVAMAPATAAGIDAATKLDVAVIGFEVEDTGPGVTPEEQAFLFEPFVQAAAGQLSQEGTGLGLAISRQHLRLMGGDIEVQSKVGQGSTFRFAVPFQVVDKTALGRAQAERQVIGLAPGQDTYRLLVVDDQDTDRQLLVRVLAPLGFDVREAANGQEAIAVWQAWQPHLIWMDMRMPVMNGYEATRHIKATTQGQATVIVALTASGMEEDRLVILSEGCDDFIRKPFYEEDVYNALSKHLGVRFLYQETAVTAEEAPNGRNGAKTRQPAPANDLQARLSGVSLNLVSALERATVLGDMAAIEAVIQQIRDQDAIVAAQLAAWARDFEHDHILSLARQATLRTLTGDDVLQGAP
ncbi:MAG TPA: two-component regulator propeller domain-containing protein [Anaerolineae bacterium]